MQDGVQIRLPLPIQQGSIVCTPAMKPTRICNWPPRLDVAVRHPPHPSRPGRRHVRPARDLHPLLRAIARARWSGRLARQRRFEQDVPARPPGG
jgi:hypothetical protein